MKTDGGRSAALRGAGRRLAVGLIAAPMVDIADDRGLLGGLARLDLDVLTGVGLAPYAWLSFFAAVGAGFAHLFPRHHLRARILFTVFVAAPVAAYWIAGGLRLSVVLAVLFIALGLVSWSMAGFDAELAP